LNAVLAGGEGESWVGIEIEPLVPATVDLWRSEPLHHEGASAPGSQVLDRFTFPVLGRSDPIWSDRVFEQYEEASFQFDELDAASVELLPTGS
jgi:hypothetical protein